jgi:hypothetical protein
MVSVVAYNPATRAFTAEEPPAGTAEPELSIEALRLRVRQGLRLVKAFTEQLRGELEVVRREPGTEFVVTVPTTERL